ncbi:hypothetical protein VIBR0546_16301 [Vibrio brasiliensis LMG 20546]|uniref:Uncharacterized protein n=1 Tax=Vibrio brasiliensis LMG 20546 TaxID=945543 RepID=E8M022_9VIBR|nr:hypothetical protein VIBR0546_16301 [Vibrio brasiliensis LMG 20546]
MIQFFTAINLLKNSRKRDERRETRDERRETRDERRETRDERRETRDERRETNLLSLRRDNSCQHLFTKGSFTVLPAPTSQRTKSVLESRRAEPVLEAQRSLWAQPALDLHAIKNPTILL